MSKQVIVLLLIAVVAFAQPHPRGDFRPQDGKVQIFYYLRSSVEHITKALKKKLDCWEPLARSWKLKKKHEISISNILETIWEMLFRFKNKSFQELTLKLPLVLLQEMLLKLLKLLFMPYHGLELFKLSVFFLQSPMWPIQLEKYYLKSLKIDLFKTF